METCKTLYFCLSKKYIKLLKEQKIIPKNLKIAKIKGGALPLKPLEQTYIDRCLLCGDAAGLINPISGEGIYYAMASGEIAAEVIVKAIKANDTSSSFLSMYQKQWKKDFGKDIKILLRTTKQWSKGNENFVKLASKDEKLTDVILSILHGGLSIEEYKWKLARRYIFVYLKNI